jgi:hypothetical protein
MAQTRSILPLLLGLAWAGAALAGAAESPARPWDTRLLREATAWPHSEKEAHIEATARGLRVGVANARSFAIAAASRLTLPAELGQVRIRVAEAGGGARWFVRLYGALRQPGEPRTVGVAQDETTTGERFFNLDPRLRTQTQTPVQLQLGVEGQPGAFVIFEDVAFLPAARRTNRAPSVGVDGQPPRDREDGQIELAAVALMPNLPEPFELIDWREKARAYDRFVFDFKARGEFLPLVWLDDSRLNLDRPTFGLPSYVGAPDQAAGKRNSQEGITCMGAVLGATLVGIDKSRQEHDYVAMCEAWFNTRNGMNLVLNRQQDAAGGSFWYELFPHLVFYGLADRYPDKPRLAEIMRITADRWGQVCQDLADARGVPDFNHTSFDFRARKPVDNGRWREPDAAAAVAWLEYAAWMKFGDSNHLGAARNCLRFLQARETNPYYEVLLPFGTLAAARLNAEQGDAYDVGRLLNWCFGISDCRGGWGVVTGNWGGYDCDGLLGSIDNRCGYAFAMNTFAQAGALAPLPRYDRRYARAIGKWLLNLANSARLFYPGALPAGHETSGFWKADPQHVIAYEGLRHDWLGRSPCATGDPVAMRWGPKTDLGLYGSSYAGLLGAIVRPTNIPRILQIDCLATDFFHGRAYPTFLCFNPYSESREVEIVTGPGPGDLYDVVGERVVARGTRDRGRFALAGDSAAVIVVLPHGAQPERQGRRVVANGVTVSWRAKPGGHPPGD